MLGVTAKQVLLLFVEANGYAFLSHVRHFDIFGGQNQDNLFHNDEFSAPNWCMKEVSAAVSG